MGHTRGGGISMDGRYDRTTSALACFRSRSPRLSQWSALTWRDLQACITRR